MRQVTINQLVSILSGTKGATAVGLTYSSAVKMVQKHRETKEPNPYIGRVSKVSHVSAIVGTNYENAVNRQREREGIDEAFVAQSRTWGERLQSTPLVTHKGAAYIECQVRNTKSVYYVDGREATHEEVADIKQYLPAQKESTTQGVENEVVWRDYNLANVSSIRMLGDEFTIG